MAEIIPVNTTYEPFSLEPEYVEANRGFIGRQPLSDRRQLLDLACGTGTVTELLLQATPRANVNGVDMDPVQIGLITERFRAKGYRVANGFELARGEENGKPVLSFGNGSADDLPFPDGTFDCVTIANAIHLLPDKERFLAAVARVLRPGGVFGFNSTFYAGAIPAQTDRVYFEWIRRASQYIEEGNAERVAQGKPPVKRKRGTTRAAFQNRWFSPAEWTGLIEQSGLAVHDTNERLVEVDARCFALAGAYGGLAEVLMSGYPVQASSEALQACAKPAMDAVGIDLVARNYLELWATRK
jgi:ubiquinone/menaquinone biosynthesis C-methylase UbiE